MVRKEGTPLQRPLRGKERYCVDGTERERKRERESRPSREKCGDVGEEREVWLEGAEPAMVHICEPL